MNPKHTRHRSKEATGPKELNPKKMTKCVTGFINITSPNTTTQQKGKTPNSRRKYTKREFTKYACYTSPMILMVSLLH